MQEPVSLVAAVTQIIMVLAHLFAIANVAKTENRLTTVLTKMTTAVYGYTRQSSKGTSCLKLMPGNSRHY